MNTKSVDPSLMSFHRGHTFPIASAPNTYRPVFRRTQNVISRVELEGRYGSVMLHQRTQVFPLLQVVDSCISKLLMGLALYDFIGAAGDEIAVARCKTFDWASVR